MAVVSNQRLGGQSLQGPVCCVSDQDIRSVFASVDLADSCVATMLRSNLG